MSINGSSVFFNASVNMEFNRRMINPNATTIYMGYGTGVNISSSPYGDIEEKIPDAVVNGKIKIITSWDKLPTKQILKSKKIDSRHTRSQLKEKEESNRPLLVDQPENNIPFLGSGHPNYRNLIKPKYYPGNGTY